MLKAFSPGIQRGGGVLCEKKLQTIQDSTAKSVSRGKTQCRIIPQPRRLGRHPASGQQLEGHTPCLHSLLREGTRGKQLRSMAIWESECDTFSGHTKDRKREQVFAHQQRHSPAQLLSHLIVVLNIFLPKCGHGGLPSGGLLGQGAGKTQGRELFIGELGRPIIPWHK